MTPDKFKSIRKHLGYNQTELAEILGCASKRVWDIENENRAGGIKRETAYAMYWLMLHGDKLPGDLA